MMVYTLRIYENFYRDEAQAPEDYGTFASLEEAVAAATEIVRADLTELVRPGMSSGELLERYRAFGEAPVIHPAVDAVRFSAWECATVLAPQIARAHPTQPGYEA